MAMHQLMVEEGLVPFAVIFVDLHEMLERRPKICDIDCAKKAKVPLTQFKVDRVDILEVELHPKPERSMAMHQSMVEEGLVPSAGWEMRRKLVIQKLE
ncbi:nuclear poly(A) polymerase 3-like [Senna tora]|uniref:Nuclear poly(A) polymerase 3-like n=1 Tax=Senna tora TaxID=362788 RepID=A0A834WFL8_9FABA|nr:nuclear poly(A) polymerase 3-like [Senna tora]